jgi:putative SOS response-associated peptidase YedK
MHDRMPVLLSQDQFDPWLRGEVGLEVLKPAADDLLQRWPRMIITEPNQFVIEVRT